MDLEALDQYLALRLIAPPLSMFRRVRKLPPGHSLVFEEGGQPVIQSYWDLAYSPKLKGSDEEPHSTHWKSKLKMRCGCTS